MPKPYQNHANKIPEPCIYMPKPTTTMLNHNLVRATPPMGDLTYRVPNLVKATLPMGDLTHLVPNLVGATPPMGLGSGAGVELEASGLGLEPALQ